HFTEESTDGSSLFYNNRKLFAVPAGEADIQLMRSVQQLNSGRVLTGSTDPRVYERKPVLDDDLAQGFSVPLAVQMKTQGILLQLLSLFIQVPEFSRQPSGTLPSKIQDTVNYIQAHLREPLSVSGLAARVHLHPDYFSRLFQENMGERPLEYIQQKKIE